MMNIFLVTTIQPQAVNEPSKLKKLRKTSLKLHEFQLHKKYLYSFRIFLKIAPLDFEGILDLYVKLYKN